eukprot:m.239711 g.239711  ORF g.239711 m.239711 type:complete len:432 (+) comp13529_c0_seq1:29-1324(+)
MSGAVFGGDEVGAVVFDIGTHTTKAGYAGEDTPKGAFPSAVGVRPAELENMMETSDETDGPAKKKSIRSTYSIGTTNIATPRKDMAFAKPLKDGLVDDWDVVEQLLNYSYSHVLRCESNDRPAMMSEASWNTKELREKMAEILFEKYQVPAMYLCKSAVLSSFSAGRSTALVLDVGASGASAVPVYDGLVLGRGIRRNILGGDYLTMQYKQLLEGPMGIPIVPQYLIGKKHAVPEGQAARFDPRAPPPNATPSFHEYMCNEVVRDFQASVCRISDHAFSEQSLTGIPTTHYEFPNGYNANFGIERYRISEAFFDPKGHSPVAGLVGHTALVADSIRSCDVDMQQTLWSSVVLSGAATLVTGYVERIHNDMSRVAPQGNKYKVIASPSSQERMFSAWIGGSMLASLGSFQQLWLSRSEYNEHGRAAIEKKCP